MIAEAEHKVVTSTRPPEPDCVPWRTSFRPGRKPGEVEWFLESLGSGEIRREGIFCPVKEMAAVGESLTGREYPLHQEVISIVKGKPVIDIGSHCGGSAVYFQEMLGPCLIHCFEPHPVAFGYLNENIGTLNCKAFSCGVSGSIGTSQYFERDAIYTSGLYSNAQPTDEKTITVQIVAGANALRSIKGEIGLVKIDAEGAESVILHSARHEIERAMVVYVEYHDDPSRRVVDQCLRGFDQFYHRTQGSGFVAQGAVGYIRKDLWFAENYK